MEDFGEIYVWPKGHEDGKELPEDFWENVQKGLESVGIEWERV